MSALFDVGTICLSRRALGLLGDAQVHPLDLIRRHELGDWGALGPVEWRQNDRAVLNGIEAIASFYRYGRGLDIWVVTDPDRKRTRLLLLDEW